MKKKIQAFVFAAVAAFTGLAAADPVSFDEAVSGNLGDTLSTVLVLGTGDNTISGSLTLGSLTQDLDTWAFQVQAGQVLTGAWLTFSSAQTASARPFTTATVDLYGCSGLDGCDPNPVQTWDLLASTPLDLMLFTWPLGEGAYTISPDTSFVSPRGEVGQLLTTAYTLHLLVADASPTSALPEPGTAVLAGVGLLAAFAGRRRSSGR